jgi:CRP-like cAMP-binding protein
VTANTWPSPRPGAASREASHVMPSPLNRLLAALRPADEQGLRAQFQDVELPLRQVLYESGAPLKHAYFPTTAIVSLMYVTQTGASFEVAAVGNEGMVGIPLFMGGGSTSSRAVVRGAGHAWRIAASALKDAFRDRPALTLLMLRYTQSLITQMSQMAVCNRHHSIDQRLCFWLLQSLDRSPGRPMALTHDLIAHAMGVRREGVSEAVRQLRDAALLAARRGEIEVIDRAGLERRSCECYAVIRRENTRLLPVRTA